MFGLIILTHNKKQLFNLTNPNLAPDEDRDLIKMVM